MSAKKTISKNGKGRPRTRRRRNPEGISLVWGVDNALTPRPKGNGGAGGRTASRKRNPAKVPEESNDTRKANDLMLRAWESIYAKRERFGKIV